VKRVRGSVLLAVSALLVAQSAGAQEPTASTENAPEDENRAQARVLFQEGNRLIERANYVDALEKFRAAYRLWQNPKIELNIATTLRELGRNAEALENYREYLRKADPSPELRSEVSAVIAELEARVAHVALAVDGDAGRVLLDGREVPPAKRAQVIVEPGRHTLLVEGKGPPSVLTFEAVAGERREVRVAAPMPEPSPAPAPAPPSAGGDAAVASHLRQARSESGLGVYARVDADVSGEGAVGGAGLSWATSSHFQVFVGALGGANFGAQAGARLAPLSGSLRPTLGVSVPVFFMDTAVVGFSGEVGLRQALSPQFFVAVQGAIVRFVNAPAGYQRTVLVPSVGVELRL